MQQEFKKIFQPIKDSVRTGYLMSRLTSFRVGGPCDCLVQPQNLQELEQAVEICRSRNILFKVVGRCTNLLVKDGGIRGVVIHIGDPFDAWKTEGESDETVKAGAAIYLPRLCREVADVGLSGLEFASGIPGSLGGGLAMNAGAYGKSLGGLVKTVTYLDPEGGVKEIPSRELKFSYRWSSLRERGGVIAEARLQLERGNPGEIHNRIEEILKLRRSKQPTLPSAGSVFKNPPDRPAGRLIEEAGCKGMQVGGAMVSQKHANFIVNTGSAKAADILELISRVRQKVEEKTGVVLEQEVEIIGED